MEGSEALGFAEMGRNCWKRAVLYMLRLKCLLHIQVGKPGCQKDEFEPNVTLV